MVIGSESEGDRPQEISQARVNRIYIWRAEVKAAQNYCVCSKPTTEDPKIPKSVGKDTLLASGSSTAVESDNRPESSHQAPPPPQPPPDPIAFTPLALKLGPPGERPPCPICSSPVDESVEFVSLRERGEAGLVRGEISPRSQADIKNLTEIMSSSKRYSTPTSKRLKRMVSKPLRLAKKVAHFRPEDEKARVKHAFKRLFRKGSKQTLSSVLPVGGEDRVRPRATEMYMAYRPDVDSAGGSVETLLDGLSDDDDDVNAHRRPRLMIDESAARLRRAQRLLDRSNKTNP